MMTPDEFTNRQFELNAEFGKFVFDHPEVDDLLPNGAHVFFEVEGETEFNEFGKKLAAKARAEGVPVIIVRTKGLIAPQGSRLIDPVIEAAVEVA
jgi:hypothetical protein